MSSAKVQSPVPCRKRRREEGRREERGGRRGKERMKTEHLPADVLAHLQKKKKMHQDLKKAKQF